MTVSHINDSILVWSYELNRISKLQKRAIRIINLSKFNAHTEQIFKRLKLLKVANILKLNDLKFYYQYENTLPIYFSKTQFILNLNNEIHHHNTRNKNNLHITRINHKYAQKMH